MNSCKDSGCDRRSALGVAVGGRVMSQCCFGVEPRKDGSIMVVSQEGEAAEYPALPARAGGDGRAIRPREIALTASVHRIDRRACAAPCVCVRRTAGGRGDPAASRGAAAPRRGGERGKGNGSRACAGPVRTARGLRCSHGHPYLSDLRSHSRSSCGARPSRLRPAVHVLAGLRSSAPQTHAPPDVFLPGATAERAASRWQRVRAAVAQVLHTWVSACARADLTAAAMHGDLARPSPQA